VEGDAEGLSTREHGARNWDDTLERIHHELYVAVRDQQGREALLEGLMTPERLRG